MVTISQTLSDPIPISAMVAVPMNQQQRWRILIAPVDVVQSEALRKIDVRGGTGNLRLHAGILAGAPKETAGAGKILIFRNLPKGNETAKPPACRPSLAGTAYGPCPN